MHYKDGTPAMLGDTVRGTGYNVKGPDGQPIEFEGVVVGLKPGEATCNLEVAVLFPWRLSSSALFPPSSGLGARLCAKDSLVVEMRTEYGQTDAFALVRRLT